MLQLNKIANTLNIYMYVTKSRHFGKIIIVDMITTTYYGFKEQRTTIFNDKKIAQSDKNKNKKKKKQRISILINLM